MYGIKDKIINEYIIQKSRFITILYPIQSKKEIVSKLEETKSEYPDATHYCYAYLYDNEKRVNDDGEPSGTAGAPILNVLENKQLNHILCIVIRYFGGIKLGASGLVRAYGKATRLAVEKADIGIITPSLLIELTYTYENSKQIQYLLKEVEVVKKEFSELITCQYLIPLQIWDTIQNKVEHITISSKIIQSTNQII